MDKLNEKLALMIGQLMMQIASLQTQIETQAVELAALKAEKPDVSV